MGALCGGARASHICSEDARWGPSSDAVFPPEGDLRRAWRFVMNFEKFTERARGFVQSAQSLALRESHQQFTPDACAQGAARRRAGAVRRPDRQGWAAVRARRCRRRKRRWRKFRMWKAPAPASFTLRRPRRGCSTTPKKSRRRRATAFVTVERLLLALAMEKGERGGKNPRRTPASPRRALNGAIDDLRKGRTADSATAENAYDALEEICARPHRGRARGQARSGDRPRRGNSPHHAGACRAAPRTIPS